MNVSYYIHPVSLSYNVNLIENAEKKMSCFPIPGTEGPYCYLLRNISTSEPNKTLNPCTGLTQIQVCNGMSCARRLCLAEFSDNITNVIYSTQSLATFGGKCGLGPADTDTYGRFPGLSPS